MLRFRNMQENLENVQFYQSKSSSLHTWSFEIANLLPIKRQSIVHWIIIPILSKLQDAPEVLGLIVPANLDAKKITTCDLFVTQNSGLNAQCI